MGVYYGAGRAEGVDHAGGRVFVVGGGNSAGQAAVFLSQFAASVTAAGPRPRPDQHHVALPDRPDRGVGEDLRRVPTPRSPAPSARRRLEGLRLRSNGTDEQEVAADALFVFVGQAPRTSWLEGVVRRDDRGFVLTGGDLGNPPPDWPLDVPPLPLETSVPGVFAAGDVRHGSVKRIASAVGEGAMAVRFAHERLAGR